MQLRTLITILVLVFSSNLFAKEDDPIDALVEQEFQAAERFGGTVIRGEHIGAYVHGQELWDTELNKTYKEIMTRISPEKKMPLRSEQRKWIKDRDLRFKKIWEEKYEEFGAGNMAELETEHLKMNFIKNRVLELRRKLHALQ